MTVEYFAESDSSNRVVSKQPKPLSSVQTILVQRINEINGLITLFTHDFPIWGHDEIMRRESISFILSLPDRITNESIPCHDFNWKLSQRWIECITAELDNSTTSLQNQYLIQLTERATRLLYHREFCRCLCGEYDRVVSSSRWTDLFSQLKLDCQFALIREFLLSTIPATLLFISDIDSSSSFPVMFNSDTPYVSTNDLDLISEKFARLFQHIQNHHLFGYLCRKLVSDSQFWFAPLSVRYVIAHSLFLIGKGYEFVAFMLSIWSNRDFASYNSCVQQHYFVGDLLLMALNRISSDLSSNSNPSCCIIRKLDSLLPSSSFSVFTAAVTAYLDCTDLDIRNRALHECEVLSLFLCDSDSSKNSRLSLDLPESEHKRWVDFISGQSKVSGFQFLKVDEDIKLCEDLSDPLSPPVLNSGNQRIVDSDDDSDASFESFQMDDSTKVKMQKVKPPRFIHECIDYLRRKSDNDPDAADRIASCLSNVGNVLEKPFLDTNPIFYGKVAGDLCHRLLHLTNQFNLPQFDENRFKSLVSLCSKYPETAGMEMINVLWNGAGIGIGQRIEIFSILIQAIKTIGGAVSNASKSQSSESSLYRAIDDIPAEDLEQTPCDSITQAGKTRITHPRSLALRKQAFLDQNQSETSTRVWQTVKMWYLPLVRGIHTSKLQWIKKEAKTFVDIRGSGSSRAASEKQVHQIQPYTLTLFCKLLTTAAQLIYICGPNYPEILGMGSEFGFLVSWFFQLVSNSVLVRGSSFEASSQNKESLVIRTPETIDLLGHNQVKMSLLFSLWTAYVVDECMVKSRLDILPFEWSYIVNAGLDVEKLLVWLQSIVVNDFNPRHRKLAIFIMNILRERMQHGK